MTNKNDEIFNYAEKLLAGDDKANLPPKPEPTNLEAVGALLLHIVKCIVATMIGIFAMLLLLTPIGWLLLAIIMWVVVFSLPSR